jgi:predicted lysophospholipase L1 biosynthesis ABC-type transport system permease subunit
VVGPSLTDSERDIASRRLKLSFVGLVAASGGLIALQAGGSLVIIAAGIVSGLVLGAVLLWFLLRWWAEFLPQPDRGRR